MAVLHQAVSKAQALAKKPGTVLKAATAAGDVDADGRSALALAARYCQAEMANHLLELKGNIDLADKEGNTPLITAVLQKDEQITLALLNAGADLSHRNKHEQKALDIALIHVEYQIDLGETAIPAEKEKAERMKEMLNNFEQQRRIFPSEEDVDEKKEKKDDKKHPKAKGKPKGHHKPGKKSVVAVEKNEEDEGGPPEEEHRIRFEQLPTRLTEDMLEEFLFGLLRQLGAEEPLSLQVVTDPITARPRGHAFASFGDAASAELALKADGRQYRGVAPRIFSDEKPSWLVKSGG